MYVYLDPFADDVHGPDRAPHGDAVVDFIDELRDQVRFLERELERKDAILLNMTEAMKAIAPPVQEEAPQELPETHVTATEQPERGSLSQLSKALRSPLSNSPGGVGCSEDSSP